MKKQGLLVLTIVCVVLFSVIAGCAEPADLSTVPDGNSVQGYQMDDVEGDVSPICLGMEIATDISEFPSQLLPNKQENSIFNDFPASYPFLGSPPDQLRIVRYRRSSYSVVIVYLADVTSYEDAEALVCEQPSVPSSSYMVFKGGNCILFSPLGSNQLKWHPLSTFQKVDKVWEFVPFEPKKPSTLDVPKEYISPENVQLV